MPRLFDYIVKESRFLEKILYGFAVFADGFWHRHSRLTKEDATLAKRITWFRVLIVGFFALNFAGCDSNGFPQSWSEFKAFNPFDSKSGAERAVIRHFDAHSQCKGGNAQFVYSTHASFGEQAESWEIRGPKIKITSISKISEAERLNGIESRAAFKVSCSAYRKRSLYPKESKEWSLWQDGGEILRGETIKRKEGWSVQFVQGGSIQVSIDSPEQYKMPEAGKGLTQTEAIEKIIEPTPSKVSAAQAAVSKGAEESSQNSLPKKLAAMVAPYAEARFFESHVRMFEGDFDAVWQAVEGTLKTRGDKVIASDRTAGTMMTDVQRHGIVGFPTHDKFFIYLEALDANHIRIEFVLFSLGPNNEGRTVPITNKEFVEKRAQKFLSLVEAALQPER